MNQEAEKKNGKNEYKIPRHGDLNVCHLSVTRMMQT